jgi:hypothetical protein
VGSTHLEKWPVEAVAYPGVVVQPGGLQAGEGQQGQAGQEGGGQHPVGSTHLEKWPVEAVAYPGVVVQPEGLQAGEGEQGQAGQAAQLVPAVQEKLHVVGCLHKNKNTPKR